jgi:PKD repeat protein
MAAGTGWTTPETTSGRAAAGGRARRAPLRRPSVSWRAWAVLALSLTVLLTPGLVGTGLGHPTISSPRSPVQGAFAKGATAAALVTRAPPPLLTSSLPVNIPVSHVAPAPSGEPTVEVNRYGTLIVNWEEQGQLDTPVGPTGFAVSNDSGKTFGHQVITQPSGSQVQWDVTGTAVSPNGTFWEGYGSSPGTCPGTSFTGDAYSNPIWDNGSHTGLPHDDLSCSLGGGSNVFLDRDWLTSTPNGTMYHVSDNWQTGEVYMSAVWNGLTYAAPKGIYDQGANGIPMNAFAYNNTLWAIADAGDSTGAGGCFVVVSQNTGQTWTEGTDPSGCAAAQPGITWEATWGAGATIDLDYADSSGLEFVQSSDLGKTWSAPVLVSGSIPAGTSFLCPTIGTDTATGELEAVWLDTRTNPTSYDWIVYEADSPDNGAHWGPVRQLSNAVVGYGSSFWPGDYIWSIVTPWGTSAAVWGDNRSQGQPGAVAVTYFAQIPLLNPAAGNLTVHVVNGATGNPIPNAQVTVNSHTSKTDVNGSVTYFAILPGSYPATAYYPGLGSGSAVASVVKGTNTSVTITIGSPPLTASATAVPTTGDAPVAVAFTGSATGGVAPYSYAWRYGDGGSLPSAAQDPQHTYNSSGSFTATLWVNDSAAHSASSQVVLTISPSLTISATASPTSGAAPLQVAFTGTASGGTAPLAEAWTFGDGGTGTGSTPSHTYTTPGAYAATFWVNDSAGATRTAQVSVTVSNPVLSATASANVTSGPSPLAVQFTGGASGGSSPYTYAWALGDGTTSTLEDPEHSFGVGHYNATLEVTDAKGTTASAGPIAINVAPNPRVPSLEVGLSAQPSSGAQVGQTITFTATATGGSGTYVAYAWTYGDGQVGSSSLATAEHAYGSAGTYTVSVKVTDSLGDVQTATLSVPVAAASPPGGASGGSSKVLGLPAPEAYGLLAAVAILIAAVVVLLLLRRRKSAPPASTTPTAWAGPSTPPEPPPQDPMGGPPG